MHSSLASLSLHDLKVIVVLSEVLHFGKAAEICGVTQPTLSASLKKVEKAVGCRLFERSSRKSELTREGESIVSAAQSALEIMGSALELNAREPARQRFRLGMIPTIGPYFVQVVIPKVLSAKSDLEIVIVEATTEELEKLVVDRSIDAAVVSLPLDTPAAKFQNLYQERLVLAVHADHPWASRKGVSVHEIDPQRLLVLDHGHCLRAQTLEACSTSQIGEKPVHSLGLSTLLGMVAAGAGYTVLPETAASWTSVGEKVVFVPFRDPQPSRLVALMTLQSRSNELLPLTQAVMEHGVLTSLP